MGTSVLGADTQRLAFDKGEEGPYDCQVVPKPAAPGAISLGNGTAGGMRASRANVDVSSVLGAGRELEFREAVALPDFGSFVFPAPADVALHVRRSGGALELKGSIAVEAAGECARCLDGVRLPLDLEVDERLEPASSPGGTDGDRSDPLSESNVLVGGELDVADLTRQLIDSALPLVLLCSEDCPGLCAECGQKPDGACRCPEPE
jgi:uncharacterized protein